MSPTTTEHHLGARYIEIYRVLEGSRSYSGASMKKLAERMGWCSGTSQAVVRHPGSSNSGELLPLKAEEEMGESVTESRE